MPTNVINKIKLPNAEVYDIQDANALPKTTTINGVSKAPNADTYTLTGNDIDISSSYNPPSSGTYSAPVIGDALEEAIGKLAYGVSQATTGGITSVDEGENSHLDITTSNSAVTVDVASGYVIPPDTVQASASGGSTLTLVSTGDKYTWDHKQDAITTIDKLSADLVDDDNTTNKFVTADDKTNWNNKLDGITVNDGTADVKVTQTKLVAGSNKVTITPDATNHTITIDSTGTTYTEGTGIDIATGDVINNTGVLNVAPDKTDSSANNGTITITKLNAAGTATEEVPVAVKGLNTAAYKDVDTSITTSTQSANLPTSAAVDAYVQNAIAGITGPMIFKGAVTINADRSITVPSTVTSIKQGYTFKITELNASYTGTLKVGDTLIAVKDDPTVTGSWVENTDWTVIPSGDEEAATYPKFEFITDYVYTRVATATTWTANTYYSRSGDTYTLTASEPADWDTNYNSYYTKSSAAGSFIGIAYSAS